MDKFYARMNKELTPTIQSRELKRVLASRPLLKFIIKENFHG
jgi:hypothetical protein